MSDWSDGRDFALSAIDEMERMWRASAKRMRAEGAFTYGGWFTKKKTVVRPVYERIALDIESACNGLAAIRQVVLSYPEGSKVVVINDKKV